ncbi:spermine/spermidine synthase [Paenibacillus sp. J2TS4]|uniref:spermine/spermidine synthase domain-containing protein n=1 Tax=Paenibacillus sp. J2TS4 TaxID=2807194 RepID=UPI001B0E00AC|nr:spermine/spermidine synthase [Paenibacillus sp. J2TS4]GIP33164.1 spermidine synthase [Paenibacillus sp. J2TS4]
MNINQSSAMLERVERRSTPRGDIQLQKRGANYEIISNGTFLMATYNGASERLLVQAALAACDKPAQVLIGGLGVGFSLAAALKEEQVEQVTVVEIEEAIISWNRTYLAEFNNQAMEDSRTVIIHADLIDWLSEGDHRYDAICLDIDNGPDWKVYEANQALYDQVGLKMLKDKLTPGGVLSFWSASSAPDFASLLKDFFPSVQELSVEQQRGEPDYIYLAKNG